MKKFLFLALMLLFVSYPKAMGTSNNETPLHDYENGREKEIMLWGSPAFVWECGDKYIFQGDIVLDKKEIDEMNNAPQLRAALVNNRKWPNNTIYYKFHSGYPGEYKGIVTYVISEIQKYTTLRFSDQSNTNYVLIKSTSGSPSSDYIGMKGGIQNISLSVNTDFMNADNDGYPQAFHEIGHVLGLFHEHCRSDRDNYVTVNYNNIPSDSRHNYRKYTEEGISGTDHGEFDFNSIMIYGSRKYPGYSGHDMVKKSTGASFTKTSKKFSPGDYQAINDKYMNTSITSSQTVVCENATVNYTLNGDLPAGASIQWAAGTNATLLSSNGRSASFKASGNGEVSVLANILVNGIIVKKEKSNSVWVGKPAKPRFVSGLPILLSGNTNYVVRFDPESSGGYPYIYQWDIQGLGDIVGATNRAELTVKTKTPFQFNNPSGGSGSEETPLNDLIINLTVGNQCGTSPLFTITKRVRSNGIILYSAEQNNDYTGIEALISSETIAAVKIYSLSGSLVYSSENITNTFDIKAINLNDGIYILEKTDTNGTVSRDKVILKR